MPGRLNRFAGWCSPPESGEGDYSFQLVQANGNSPPAILCVLNGNPALYVTEHAVFRGPTQALSLLDPRKENRVPAPAIERARGIRFLQQLDLPLPERIAERVRSLPLDVFIQCALRTSPFNPRTEECTFEVHALAADGHEESWNGAQWHVENERDKKKSGGDEIIVYDRSGAELVPQLFSALGLKINTWNGEMLLRVTKKFPKVFSSWLRSVPSAIKVELAGELASFVSADVAGTVKLDVKEAEIDWFDLRVVLDVTDTTLSQEGDSLAVECARELRAARRQRLAAAAI